MLPRFDRKGSSVALLVAHMVAVLALSHYTLSASWLKPEASPSPTATPSQRTPDTPNRVLLNNGLTVLLYPLAGADRVAIESFYRVGFLHEPRDMTQAAHLLEHLVIRSATRNYQAGKAERLLNQKGLVNAETLPTITHYDYILPANELELGLRLEAERLSSLKITPKEIQREAQRCYQEADFAERNAKAGMLKQAFMVLNQAWRYGSDNAWVRRGLENISVAELERFHGAFYHTRNALLVIVGGFNREEAMQMVKRYLGNVDLPTPTRPQPPSWTKLPREMTVHWDSKLRAVCIGFPPPEESQERIVLSLWGNLLLQTLMSDTEVQTLAGALFCTNQLWSAETLPFFIYATAKGKVSVSKLQKTLQQRLRSLTAEVPSDAEMRQLHAMIAELAQPPKLNWDTIRQQGNRVSIQSALPRNRATWMLLGNLTIHLGVRQLLLGPVRRRQIQALQAFTADELFRLLQRTLAPSKQFVTVLMPMKPSR